MPTYRFSIDQVQIINQKADHNHSDNDFLSLVWTVSNSVTKSTQTFNKTMQVGGILHTGDVIPGPFATDPFVVGDNDSLTLTLALTNLGSSDSAAQFTAAVKITESIVQTVAPLVGAVVGGIVAGDPDLGSEIGQEISGAISQVTGLISDVADALGIHVGAPNCNGEVFHDSWTYSASELAQATGQAGSRSYTGPAKDGCGIAPNTKITFSVAPVAAAGSAVIYAVDSKSELLWYRHLGASTGADHWMTTPDPKGHIGEGWNMKQVFSGGDGIIYAIDQKDQLLWYKHLGFIDGKDQWQTTPDPKGHIGEGWNMKQVFCGGSGVIYAIDQQNNLLWFKHLGFADGTDRWQTTPEKKGHIGEGWGPGLVFSGGNGIIYAVNPAKELLWYKHLGFADGTDRWQTTPDKKGHIGEGWSFSQIFSAGEGVIYAVNDKKNLLWFKHLGFADGTDKWQTTPDPKGYIGEGWNMKQVFSGGF